MVIREATAADWAAIWPILQEVGAAGETLTWDPRTTEARARAGWMRELPGRTIVAVDDDGSVLGSANTHPNHAGPGHTSPMPDSSCTRRGATWAQAGLCAVMSWNRHAQTVTGPCSSMP